MPTYTFQCQKKKCAHMIDVFRSIAERDSPPPFCEQCGGQGLKRLLAAPAGTVKDGHNSEYNKYGPNY